MVGDPALPGEQFKGGHVGPGDVGQDWVGQSSGWFADGAFWPGKASVGRTPQYAADGKGSVVSGGGVCGRLFGST